MFKYLVIIASLLYAKKVYSARIERINKASKVVVVNREAELDSIN